MLIITQLGMKYFYARSEKFRFSKALSVPLRFLFFLNNLKEFWQSPWSCFPVNKSLSAKQLTCQLYENKGERMDLGTMKGQSMWSIWKGQYMSKLFINCYWNTYWFLLKRKYKLTERTSSEYNTAGVLSEHQTCG